MAFGSSHRQIHPYMETANWNAINELLDGVSL